MKELDDLLACYQQYLEFTKKLKEKASPTGGLLGFGSGPEDDPGHEAFYDRVGELVQAFLAADPTPAEVNEAATLILCSAAEHEEDKLAFWFLFAGQGHARALIPLLSREDCIHLRDYYDAHYPKSSRMPVQKEVYKLLKQHASGKI